jgi:hypothetical protein
LTDKGDIRRFEKKSGQQFTKSEIKDFETISIHIPGDGNFRIKNVKEELMRVRKKVKGLKLEKPVKPRAGVKQIPLKESPETAKQLEQAEKQDKIAKEQFEKSLKSGVPTQSRARFEEATKELEEKAQLKSEKKILERGKETPPLPRNDEPKFGIGLGGISLPKIDIKIGKRKELKVTFDDATKERDWNDARGLRKRRHPR